MASTERYQNLKHSQRCIFDRRQLIDAVLTSEEISVLLHAQGALDDYSRKPDCFRKAAGFIQSHCAELDMNESERVNAAISMTLCELATASHHSFPLECVPFSMKSYLKEQNAEMIRLQGECVEALSRSAQFWSSYSGYLRETPQLCFAFRRWNDIDVARDIYINITFDQAVLLQHVNQREQATEINMVSLGNRLSDLYDVVSQFRAAANDISNGAGQLDSWLNTSLDHTLSALRSSTTVLRKEQEHFSSRVLDQTSTALEDLYLRYADSVQSLSPAIESILLQHVDKMLTDFYIKSQTSIDITNRIHDEWISLSNGLHGLTQSVVILSATGSEVAHSLETSIKQARILNQMQFDASVSATALIATLSNLTTNTHAELEKIANVSAALLQRNSQLRSSHDILSWLDLGYSRILGFRSPIHFGSNPLGYLVHLPLSTVFCFVGFLFRATFSGIMTFGFLCLSMRRYFLKKLNLSTTSATRSPTVTTQTSLKHLYDDNSGFHMDPRLRRHVLSRVSRIPEHLYRPVQDF